MVEVGKDSKKKFGGGEDFNKFLRKSATTQKILRPGKNRDENATVRLNTKSNINNSIT